MEYLPYIVSWNITERCNLRCPHCYMDSGDEVSSQELTTDEARLVIDELTYLNRNLMLVLSGGEPMLRKDIYEIISYAREGGFIVVMGSNGTLIKEEELRLLKEAGLKGLGISIDFIEPSRHDSFRGMNGAWEASYFALRRARELGIETQMDVTLTDANYHQMEHFIELAHELGVKALNFFFLVCTGRARRTDISTRNYNIALKRITELSLSEKRLMVRARCAPHIYRLMYESGARPSKGIKGCLAGRHYMRITPQGYVTPCPYMDLRAGDLRRNSILEIWEGSSLMGELRDERYTGRCGACEYRFICGGCRARAYAETGDLMADDPLCDYMPEGKNIEEGDSFSSSLQWEEEARRRIERIPLFMRGMIVRMIETRARQLGLDIITSEFIDDLKMHAMGMHRK